MTSHDKTDGAVGKNEDMPQTQRDIIDRIRSQCEANGFTMSSLAVHVGLSDNAGRQWNTYRALPRHTALMDIARALGVASNWLITGEDTPADKAITQIERETLATMRELPVEIQEMLLAQARALAEREKVKKR